NKFGHKLCCLANYRYRSIQVKRKRANAKQEAGTGIKALTRLVSFHIPRYQVFVIMARNWANRGVESWGPGEASGWYCTQKIGLVLWRIPSTVWSLRLIRSTITSAGSVLGS